MLCFKYRALDSKGVAHTGSIHAVNVAELNAVLASRGLAVVSCRRTLFNFQGLHSQRFGFSATNPGARRAGVSQRQLITFTIQLQQLLAAGVPLLEALQGLHEGGESQAMRSLLSTLMRDIEGGKSLAAACGAHAGVFDSLYCSLLEVGQQSGKLSEILAQLAALLKGQAETAGRIKNIILYPLFVAFVLLVVIAFVMVYLVPQLVSFITSSGAVLPWHTLVLMACSNFISSYWYWLVVLAMLTLVAVKAMGRHPVFASAVDRFKLRIPLFGPVLLKLKVARFARCCATMYGAGVPITELLLLAAGTLQNQALENSVHGAAREVYRGASVSATLADGGIFPPLVSQMLRVGENTGALDLSFEQVAWFYDSESTDAITKLEQSIGPILIVLVGLIMVWVVVSVLGPIYDLVFNLQGTL